MSARPLDVGTRLSPRRNNLWAVRTALGGMPAMTRRGAALGILVAVVLLLTLTPVVPSPAGSFEVRLAEDRRLADAILNVLLFVPLGALMAARGTSLLVTGLAAFLLSGLIEGGQLLLTTARDPTIRDLLANGVGGLAGHRGYVAIADSAAARGRRVAAYLIGGGSAALFAAGALLLPVTAPRTELALFRTPGRPLPADADWTVDGAWIGGDALVHGRPEPATTARLRAFLEGEAELIVHGRSGKSTASPRPLLVAVDEAARYRFGLEAHGSALVVRWPRRADAWMLDNPPQRFEDVFHPDSSAGGAAAFRLVLERRPEGACLSSGGWARCRPDAGLARAWALLLAPRSWSEGRLRLVNGLFLALLFLGVGALCRGSVTTLVCGGTVLTLFGVLPAVTPVPYPTLPCLGWATAGLLAGLLLSRRGGARPGPRPPTRPPSGPGRDPAARPDPPGTPAAPGPRPSGA